MAQLLKDNKFHEYCKVLKVSGQSPGDPEKRVIEKSKNMLKYTNLEHTFSSWRLQCAPKFEKKSEFLWSDVIQKFFKHFSEFSQGYKDQL